MYLLDYREELEITDVKESDIISFQKRFLTKMAEELNTVKASDIQIQDNKITFYVPFFRLVSNWNILVPIDSGHIEILPSSKNVVISYSISFKRLFILGTLLIIVFGTILFQDTRVSITQKLVLISVSWLFIIGVNWLIGIVRIPAFIERIISDCARAKD